MGLGPAHRHGLKHKSIRYFRLLSSRHPPCAFVLISTASRNVLAWSGSRPSDRHQPTRRDRACPGQRSRDDACQRRSPTDDHCPHGKCADGVPADRMMDSSTTKDITAGMIGAEMRKSVTPGFISSCPRCRWQHGWTARPAAISTIRSRLWFYPLAMTRATVSPHTGRSATHAAGAITEIDSVTVKRALASWPPWSVS